MSGWDQPEFDWNDENLRHVARHGVSAHEAEEAILDPNVLLVDIQYIDDEERDRMVGRTQAGRLLTVIVTMRKNLIRPVTAFDASAEMSKAYWQNSI